MNQDQNGTISPSHVSPLEMEKVTKQFSHEAIDQILDEPSIDDLPMTQILPQDFGPEAKKKKRGRPRSNDSERIESKRLRRKPSIELIGIERKEEDIFLGEKQTDATKRSEFVVTWLYKHYQASETTSVPRSAVFSKYVGDSITGGMVPVNPATFGKMIRAVFPELRTRRLGTRGNSKYHYFGIAPIGRPQGAPDDPDYVVEGEPRRKIRLPLKAEQHIRSRKICGEATQLLDQLTQTKQQAPVPNSSLTGAPFCPLIPDFEEFARFVEQICQPIPEKLTGATPLLMQRFSGLYQNHIVHILKLISAREFHMVEMVLGIFWSSLPQELWACLHCGEGIRIISIADDYLFQVAIHILIPEVLEPLPLAVAQSIRYFAKSLDIWMNQIFDTSIPTPVVNAKLDVSRRFCQVLRRRTALNHLAQAVRTILCSTEHLYGMLQDFGHLDFFAIQDQVQWVLPGQNDFVSYMEASLRNYLFEGVTIQQWAQWLEAMLDQSITADLSMNIELDLSARNILLRWSLLTSMIMRDLTLRSANSFDEYVMYYMEKKLDEHRRAMGLLAYWPAHQDQPQHFGYESAMAGFASMDDLFRKSGLLAYSQPAYMQPSEAMTTSLPEAA